MSRIRVLIGIALVATGVAWLFGGTEALLTIGRHAPVGVAVLLVTVGVWSAAHTLDPGGRLTGPLLVIGAGVVVFVIAVVDLPAPTWRLVGQVCVIAAGSLIALVGARRRTDVYTGVFRCVTVLAPRNRVVPVPTPTKVELLALLGPISLDIVGADLSPGEQLDIEVTTLWANVTVRMPVGWLLAPGNVRHTPLVTIDAQFTAAVRASPEPATTGEEAARTVTLHVMGWGGSVAVTATPAASGSSTR